MALIIAIATTATKLRQVPIVTCKRFRTIKFNQMDKMRSLLTIILLSSFGQLFCQPLKSTDYNLKIEKGNIVKEGKRKFLLVQTTLTNQSKDTLRYHSKSCSWQDYYSINNDKLKIDISVCDKNIPIVLILPPKQGRQVVIKIEVPGRLNIDKLKFRIGFHLLEDRTYMDNYEVGEEFKKNVVWSNEIVL